MLERVWDPELERSLDRPLQVVFPSLWVGTVPVAVEFPRPLLDSDSDSDSDRDSVCSCLKERPRYCLHKYFCRQLFGLEVLDDMHYCYTTASASVSREVPDSPNRSI